LYECLVPTPESNISGKTLSRVSAKIETIPEEEEKEARVIYEDDSFDDVIENNMSNIQFDSNNEMNLETDG
jgi:hypothetical protein